MDEQTNTGFTATRKAARPRPALFLAMGRSVPPPTVEIGGKTYHLSRLFKHDSWAATALYEGTKSDRVVVKFNRQQPIFGLPMQWLGRALARRETGMLQRLSGLVNVPAACGPVEMDGQVVSTASAHEFVPGRSLMATDQVDDEFFPRLSFLLRQLHDRGVAYIDLHKRDNILVDDKGVPHLIDFQISLYLPPRWPFSSVLNILQSCDRYHVAKHQLHFRPDQQTEPLARPAWIKAHRLLAAPLRQLRRSLLVRLGIRLGGGMAASEHAPQEELREKPVSIVAFQPNSHQPANATPNANLHRAA